MESIGDQQISLIAFCSDTNNELRRHTYVPSLVPGQPESCVEGRCTPGATASLSSQHYSLKTHLEQMETISLDTRVPGECGEKKNKKKTKGSEQPSGQNNALPYGMSWIGFQELLVIRTRTFVDVAFFSAHQIANGEREG